MIELVYSPEKELIEEFSRGMVLEDMGSERPSSAENLMKSERGST